MIKAIVNGTVFDGEMPLDNHAVLVKNGKILEVLPTQQVPKNIEIEFDLNGGCLTPGFIDLQVNGGGGVLFNNTPSVKAIQEIGEAHSQYGTTGFLPTLITESFDVMREAIAAVSLAIEEGVPGVLGIHLEGPFLNAEKKGVHNADRFCALDDQGFDIITSLKLGKTLITIAPERTSVEMIRKISAEGVIISAGHSAACYEQTSEALAAGVSGFTHLYNAMTPLQSREPGVVGAALEDDQSWFGIIADGHHVHPAAFRVAIKAKKQGGAILVTDAMPSVGATDKSFVLDGEIIEVVDGRCRNAAGALAGSDLDMISAINNATDFAGIDWFEAVRMASLYPAKALNLEDQFGYIKPGYTANLVALNGQRQVVRTWVQGQTHFN